MQFLVALEEYSHSAESCLIKAPIDRSVNSDRCHSFCQSITKQRWPFEIFIRSWTSCFLTTRGKYLYFSARNYACQSGSHFAKNKISGVDSPIWPNPLTPADTVSTSTRSRRTLQGNWSHGQWGRKKTQRLAVQWWHFEGSKRKSQSFHLIFGKTNNHLCLTLSSTVY